ncbi:hypothetical protein [Lysobacter solisilvae (ex Woo and Kim 2020)]|uniref:Transcription elongation factor n=1 Tax=Agrilutibacter terrestris TaxID=2865112 RepID=A0A7H0FUZ3_9GAMM|nr:hypothetical protein [Lysobacter terrestris]QNP39859.1 hypothetical protein H8B22_10110 [Lysobacter terrestris]
MDKTALRNALLALERHELQAAREAYADYLAGSKPDRADTEDDQDHSLAVEDAELAQGLEGPLQAAQDAMARLQAIDFAPRTTVAPGAVLELGGQRFVVAVATQQFKVGAQTYMGISTESPLYRAAYGKAAGDTVEFAGRPHRIDRID